MAYDQVTADLLRENERLREALEHIATGRRWTGSRWATNYDPARIARKALEAQPEPAFDEDRP
jgi:hypothetical protein